MKKEIKPGKYWNAAWSLVDGCTHVSLACDHCWLKGMNDRFQKYDWDKVTFREDRLNVPKKIGPPTVFSVWSDLFHDEVVDHDKWWQVFEMIENCPQHTFLVCTKRPEIAIGMLYEMAHGDPEIGMFGYEPLRRCGNLWIGTTVENQEMAIERIPHLVELAKMGAKTFISIEPMLGPVDLIEAISWASGNQQTRGKCGPNMDHRQSSLVVNQVMVPDQCIQIGPERSGMIAMWLVCHFISSSGVNGGWPPTMILLFVLEIPCIISVMVSG